MSNYFQLLPNFKYQNLLENSLKGDKIAVKNIFKRAKIRTDIFNNLVFFQNYSIVGDERPDQVADKFYDDPDLDWVILIANNVLNMQSEWPIPQLVYNNYLISKYGSEEKLFETHHFESQELTDSTGAVIFPEGLIIPENYEFEYFDSNIQQKKFHTNFGTPITNYVYEERLQDTRRSIFVLKSEYLNIVLDDIKDIFKYKKGSSEYISGTLKDTTI
jgi:hypothetical protein